MERECLHCFILSLYKWGPRLLAPHGNEKWSLHHSKPIKEKLGLCFSTPTKGVRVAKIHGEKRGNFRVQSFGLSFLGSHIVEIYSLFGMRFFGYIWALFGPRVFYYLSFVMLFFC